MIPYDKGTRIARISRAGAVSYITPGDQVFQLYDGAVGPDGNLWTAELSGIDRITAAGHVTAFPFARPDAASRGDGERADGEASLLVQGPGNALWFSHSGSNSVGRIAGDGRMTEFPLPTPRYPAGMAADPDGSVWFVERYRNAIAHLRADGKVQEFALPVAQPSTQDSGIIVGPDGGVWFADPANVAIGHLAAGQLREYPLPTPGSNITSDGAPYGIVGGPDGNLWFTVPGRARIGRITPSGAISMFDVPNASLPHGTGPGIAAGRDGNLWFAEYGRDAGGGIGRITTGGQTREYPLPEDRGGYAEMAYDIARGQDGNLWFTVPDGKRIGRIDIRGQIREFALPAHRSGPDGPRGPDDQATGGADFDREFRRDAPDHIAAGLDGNLWFTELTGDRIGRISPSGRIDEFALPRPGSLPCGIVPAKDGGAWFSELYNNTIGHISAGGTIREYPLPTGA